jgi:hypothetical protein
MNDLIKHLLENKPKIIVTQTDTEFRVQIGTLVTGRGGLCSILNQFPIFDIDLNGKLLNEEEKETLKLSCCLKPSEEELRLGYVFLKNISNDKTNLK